MRMTRTLVFAPLLGALSLGACKPKTDPNAAVHADSAGVEIIRSSGKYRPIKWAFDTVFVIGGAGDSAFQRVRDHTVDVSRDGHIMVLDTDRRRVEIYGADGRLVKRLEPGGEAPIAMPSAVVTHGNEFVVYDVDKWSLIRISPEGKYLGTMPAPRQLRQGVLRSDSSAFVLGQRVQDTKTNTPVMSIVRVTDKDTTSIIAAALEEANSTFLPVCGGVQLMLEPIFADPPAWTARHGVTAVAEAPLYGVRLYRGTTEFRRIRRNLQPEESTNQFAALAAEPGKEIRRLDGSRCTIPAVEIARASGWKNVIPAIKAIALTPDGGMWLQRVDPGHSHPNVDIIDAKGEYVGTLPRNTPWPVGFLPNGNPVALAEDTLGVTRVIAYKVNTNPPPPAKPKPSN
jgi:hypothetical protein